MMHSLSSDNFILTLTDIITTSVFFTPNTDGQDMTCATCAAVPTTVWSVTSDDRNTSTCCWQNAFVYRTTKNTIGYIELCYGVQNVR